MCSRRGVTNLRRRVVDGLVAGGVEGGGGGAHGHALAGADLAGEDAEAALVDEPGEPGHGLLVSGRAVERRGRDVAAEGEAGEAPVGAEAVDAHSGSSGEVVASGSDAERLR